MIVINESNEDIFTQICKALDNKKVRYTVRGKRNNFLVVSKRDLDAASEIRNKFDPNYTITIANAV